ncbi:MAG: GTPase Era [Acidaminococcus sp.]|jgi:GTP-binding protein Era|nr:GTPase Era [Acidaminococcus sp.]MCI2099524.1 GTPase Era [Acidaminococcus sp.]MCI2113609.1 GTPase Era [Acidaminococcus sp.]MCI2115692.1 GTPase Era [Acidaminococcus sp.]
MTNEATKTQHRSGFVAVVGRPNAGKSTLINKLVGEKVAIISDRPQTTRTRILSIVSVPEAQIIFLDTPGLHKPMDKLGEHMVKAAEDSLKDVDAVLYLVDITEKSMKAEKYIIERLQNVKVPVFLILNKVDQIPDETVLLPKIDAFRKAYPFRDVFPLSALEDKDFSELMNAIIGALPEGPDFYPEDMYTDQTERVMAAEIIREKILHLTRDEVPHAVAVQVNEMKTRDNGTVYVRGDIFVERDSQKAILIGRKGSMLKQISSEARKDIEDLVGSHVYLELWVKVRPKWREKESDLKQLGLAEK